MNEQTIYQNGRYKVVPLTVGYIVKGRQGQTLFRYAPEEIEDAVQTVDEMAIADGVYEAVA